MYDNVVRNKRPLAPRHPEKTTNIGEFVVVQNTGSRYHVEVQPNITLRAAKRIASIIVQHGKTNPSAKLNQLIGGKEQSFGLVKHMSRKHLINIIMSGKGQVAQYVVVSEQAGGALGSKFWTHPGLSSLLSR
jgi:hypothetical protein